MTPSAGTTAPVSEKGPRPDRALLWSALVAALVEALTLTAVGWHSHWLAHPQKTHGLDPSQFLETQVVTLPQEHHLVEAKAPAAPAARREPVMSKVSGQGRKAKPHETKLPEENKTKTPAEHAGQEPLLGPTHGPVAIYNPLPTIPSYLQSDNLNKTVVIEFFITAQGAVTPRLIATSGNEELDAIALETVKKWQFRPAENDHKAVDAKVRLRIVFDVH